MQLEFQIIRKKDADFSNPKIMRESSAFPPDSGHSCDELGKVVDVDIKPSSGVYPFAGGCAGVGVGGTETGGSVSQHPKWQAHMVDSWMDLCDGALQDM